MNIVNQAMSYLTTGNILFGGVLLCFTTWLCSKLRFYSWYLVVLVSSFVWAVMVVDEAMYFYVFVLGMLTAFAEVIGKYGDEPIKALRNWYAIFYHILNGLLAIFALKLLIINDVKISTDMEKIKIVLTAGLGSMLIMRSKLFNIKVGGQEIAVGPDQIMMVFFSFMQESIDRVRSLSRISFVKEKLQDIDVEKVYKYCKVMLDSSQGKEGKIDKVKERIDELVSSAINYDDKQDKAYSLGFILLNEMGEDFVSTLFDKAPCDWKFRAPVEESRTSMLGRVQSYVTGTESLQCMAYSSLMSGKELRMRLGWTDMEETKFREQTNPQKCILKKYRLTFNKPESDSNTGVGRANIVEDADVNEFVEGVVYQLPKPVVEFLDKNEVGYIRKPISVNIGEKTTDVQVYIAESPLDGLKPDKDYLETILAGAREHQLSPQYIAKIESFK